MDSAAVTPSDFTVMLENYPLGGNKDIKTVTTQIKDYLNQHYDGAGDKLVYVNPTYNTGKLNKHLENLYFEYDKLTKANLYLAKACNGDKNMYI